MLWWFEREGLKTQVEVLQLSSNEYELHVVEADGVEHIEKFTDAVALAKRQRQIQDQLVSQGWKGTAKWLG